MSRHERPKWTLGAIASANLGTEGDAVPPGPFVYMLRWQVVRDAYERFPTVDQVADYWGESRRTAFRWQAIFRAAFPGEHDPGRVLRAASLGVPLSGGWRGLSEAQAFVEILEEDDG